MRVIRVLAILFMTLPLCAQEAPSDAISPAERTLRPLPGEVPVAFEITGSPSASGRSTNLRLEVTSGDITALRVYSEPSHTLIAAFLDNSDGEEASTRRAASFRFAKTDMIASMPLHAGTKVSTQGRRPASGDVKLALLIRSRYAGETEDTEREANVRTNLDSFHFGFKQFASFGQICCNGGDCGGNCRFCAGNNYACCLENGCTFCGAATAYCSSDPCPHC
jgi:hypothetical protein